MPQVLKSSRGFVVAAVMASMFMVAGFLQRRIGPRTVATIGAVLFSSGMFLGSLVHSLRRIGGRLGIAAICIGGGEATAVLIENLAA